MGIRLTGETRSAVAMHEPEQETMTPPKAVLDEHSPGYYGWRVLAVSVVGMALSVGPLFWGSLGLLVGSLQTQFGWSRAQIMLALTWLTLTSVPAMPIVGRLIDRFGARRVLLPSIAVLAVTLAAVPFCVASRWHFYACFALAGFLTVGTQSVSYIRILSSWFDRRRGLAIGIAASGLGLGYLVVPMIVQAVLSVEDWPAVYWAMAALVGFVSLPLMYAVVRNDPPSDEARSGTVGAAARASGGMLLAEALRTREFWLIAAGIFIVSAVDQALMQNYVNFLRVDKGLDLRETISWAGTLLAIVGVVAKIGSGWIYDRFSIRGIAYFYLLLGISLFLGLPVAGTLSLLLFIVVRGVAHGGLIVDVPILTKHYFGTERMGMTIGIMSVCVNLGFAAGPPLFGWFADTYGNFSTGIIVFGSAATLSTLTIWWIKPRYWTPPAQREREILAGQPSVDVGR